LFCRDVSRDKTVSRITTVLSTSPKEEKMSDSEQGHKRERTYGFDFAVRRSPDANVPRGCGVPGCKSDKCACVSVPINYFGVMFDTDVCEDCLPLVTVGKINVRAA